VRYLKLVYLLVGLALLAAVVAEVDVAEVAGRVVQVGWGIGVILGLYLAAFVIDSFTWQMALLEVPLDGRWLYRTWKARMVGEAFNSVIPAAGMGGEPVKAVLLKKYYGIGYRQGTASLFLGKTINMIALVVFLGGGFALMLGSPLLSASYKLVAGAGLAAVTLGTFLFFIIQRLRITSLAGTWLSRWRFAARIESVLDHVRDMDGRLSSFYTDHRGRFAGAVALALVNWLIGILEIYYTMIFLGHPVTLVDAWIIEAMAQMVRTGTFFIPASIGAQEGAFLLVCGAMTGSPSLGVAVALVRRFREVLWIVWGFVLASLFSFKPTFAGEPE
jgi:glycosyltransferase 2 family protein